AAPVISSITSGATFQPGAVSPGEIISIFGAGVGPALPADGVQFTPVSGKVPTTLGGVTVTFNNGIQAPLLFVSAKQINCIVPYEMAGQLQTSVVVGFAGNTSPVFEVRITDTTPAIFSETEGGNGQGAILNQNLTVNSASNPAAKGSVVSIYATGE